MARRQAQCSLKQMAVPAILSGIAAVIIVKFVMPRVATATSMAITQLRTGPITMPRPTPTRCRLSEVETIVGYAGRNPIWGCAPKPTDTVETCIKACSAKYSNPLISSPPVVVYR